jgi:hypothetical protein
MASAGGRPRFSLADLRILGVVLLVAVVVAAVALWPRGDDDRAADPGAPASATAAASASPEPSSSPSGSAAPVGTASDDAWCADFRDLAALQDQYVASGGSTEALAAAATDMAELGLPASMPAIAVGGWYVLLDGIFEVARATPPPGTFLDDPPADQGYDADEAFTQYTTEYCPAG